MINALKTSEAGAAVAGRRQRRRSGAVEASGDIAPVDHGAYSCLPISNAPASGWWRHCRGGVSSVAGEGITRMASFNVNIEIE